MRRKFFGLISRAAAIAATLGAAALQPAAASATPRVETPILEAAVAEGALPPVAERLPKTPLVVDLAGRGRERGVHGGVWRMMISKAKHARYGNVYGYARLVGYASDLSLKPDILRDVEVVEGRIFTLKLRAGHKWSDGHPFTSEDFRYWWQDVANNPSLSPAGPPVDLLVDGEPPQVSFPDAETVVFEWAKPHPTFLKLLAMARPPFIYRPAHYLKRFHAKYTDETTLAYAIADAKARSWAALHNRKDNMYKGDNADLPTLQPWAPKGSPNGVRFVWERNPYFHRVDASGRQLPYIDAIHMSVVSSGLIPAKTRIGEADLQAIGLPFSEAAVLKAGEDERGYDMRIWENGVASEVAIYPNLNYHDDGWRAVLRDARFRQALSLAVKRDVINRALFFELAKPAATSLLSTSPLYDEANANAFAEYDPERANKLLDAAGLDKRDADGVRLLPDGRRLEVVVETAGERVIVEKTMQFVARSWEEIGVKLLLKPADRDILRNRVYAGEAMMAVWYGWDNGLATPADPPDEVAPMRQDTFSWPKWGQFHQTGGKAGEAPDMPVAERLLALCERWYATADAGERAAIWREILAIHAEQVFSIGIVNAAPHLVVVTKGLKNVPAKAVWAWDPGAQFGVHRPDEFFFAPEE